MREAVEERVVFYWGGEGGPERVGGDECFREDYEVRFVGCGFADESDGFLDGFGGVEEDGSDVACWTGG